MMPVRVSGRRSRTVAGIAVAGVVAAIALRLDPRDLLDAGSGETLGRFLAAALRPTLVSESGSGSSLLPELGSGIVATVEFAAAGLGLALLAAAPLGLAASSLWWDNGAAGPARGRAARVARAVGPVVTAAARAMLSVLRSVHELLWAMLFLAAFGLSHTGAVLAIAIPYAGTLAKVFSEMIDEAPRDAAHAATAAGASFPQAFLVGILPRALPDMASYAFYRFECALRSSAVLGFFGLPTLGYHLSLAFDNLLFREVWTYLWAMFALIALMELWSSALRQRGRWA